MKTALLLCGFVRDLNYIKRIKIFLDKNSNHDIDVYSHTYNIVGLPVKHSSDRNYYKKGGKLDSNFSQPYFSFKNIFIEDYDDMCNELEKYVSEKQFDVRKRTERVKKRMEERMLSPDTENSIIERQYGQWRAVWKTFNLIESYMKYDCIIRSRYDMDISNIDLDFYCAQIEKSENTIFQKKQLSQLNRNLLTLDNGVCLESLNIDGFALGDSNIMKTYCEFGSENVFENVMKDENFESQSFFDYAGKSIKMSQESCLVYYMHILKKIKRGQILDSHLPGKGVVRKQKRPDGSK